MGLTLSSLGQGSWAVSAGVSKENAVFKPGKSSEKKILKNFCAQKRKIEIDAMSFAMSLHSYKMDAHWSCRFICFWVKGLETNVA